MTEREEHRIEAEIETARADAARLRAVHATHLLDEPAVASLDRLTSLAATLLDAPVAFISLVDAERDYYASHSGFPEPLASSRELKGTTFCHHALVSDGPLVIGDTRAHPIYRNVPTVASLGVAAYLGAPITAGGHVVGSFCVIDFKPHPWSPRDLTVIEELAASAAREISLLAAIGHHARRAEEAQAARLVAERIVTSRREVINAVVHDLRDPLNSILLALGPMKAGPAAGEAPHARLIGVIHRQVGRMSAMLEDLMDVARIDGGSLHIQPQPTEIEGVLREVTSNFDMSAENAGVAIEVDVADGLSPFPVDRARIVQALSNLLSNAIKFTPQGGCARLSARPEGEWLAIEVSDTGCGIDPSKLERLFEPFWQANPGARKGAGLGLHIVRGIVERHGGTIEVRSAPGAGTAFTIRLPHALPGG